MAISALPSLFYGTSNDGVEWQTKGWEREEGGYRYYYTLRADGRCRLDRDPKRLLGTRQRVRFYRGGDHFEADLVIKSVTFDVNNSYYAAITAEASL